MCYRKVFLFEGTTSIHETNAIHQCVIQRFFVFDGTTSIHVSNSGAEQRTLSGEGERILGYSKLLGRRHPLPCSLDHLPLCGYHISQFASIHSVCQKGPKTSSDTPPAPPGRIEILIMDEKTVNRT